VVYKGFESSGNTARGREGGADAADSAEELGWMCVSHKRDVEGEKMYLAVTEEGMV